MTQADWLASRHPAMMLRFLGGRATPRRLRLFLCACCYSVWDSLPAWCRTAVEVGEGYADGAVTKPARRSAERANEAKGKLQ